MGHKTLVNGTAYDITGGKTLVSGTSYDIALGKTLVSGTAYNITFVPLITFNLLKGDSADVLQTYQCEEGMTWGEFINSSYNTGTYTCYLNSNYVFVTPEFSVSAIPAGLSRAASSDVISSEKQYPVYRKSGVYDPTPGGVV